MDLNSHKNILPRSKKFEKYAVVQKRKPLKK